ncbi:hypothetical protein B0J14DRAFT_576128 [Halenospora varia]|nr:hypothetical protein B0J14DRAFT_576128 [Halenospora varia]
MQRVRISDSTQKETAPCKALRSSTHRRKTKNQLKTQCNARSENTRRISSRLSRSLIPREGTTSNRSLHNSKKAQQTIPRSRTHQTPLQQTVPLLTFTERNSRSDIRIRTHLTTYIARLPYRSKLFRAQEEVYPFKPQTLGLVLLNRQTYLEGQEVLYSENTFFFEKPRQLLDFETRIGPQNRDLIRSLAVKMTYDPNENDISMSEFWEDRDSFFPGMPEHESYPSKWAYRLLKSGSRRVEHLVLEIGHGVGPEEVYEWRREYVDMVVARHLRDAVERV